VRTFRRASATRFRRLPVGMLLASVVGDAGRTNAQIAAQLYISVHTVSSHLDRIRDKTGCRRRADLTRLALSAHLV
jgi:FixJ family two-component response regulator